MTGEKPTGRKQVSIGERFAVWPALFFAAVVLAVYGHAAWTLRSSELVESDEPAHFTTGVMVYEYVRTALGTPVPNSLPANPLKFAQSFYFRFPKVGLGQWPPVFYVVEAAAFFLLGPTQAAARALAGAIAFTIAGVLAWRVRRTSGWGNGILAGAVFLSIPTVRLAAWEVMSDLLTGLFMTFAVLAFCDFLESGDGKSSLRFVLWSVLAILTKGDAWAVGIFAIVAPALTGRWNVIRSRWYWIAAAVIVALSAPFYWLTRAAGLGYFQDVTRVVSKTHFAWRTLKLAIPFFTPLFAAIAAVGFGWAVYRRWVRREQTQEVRERLSLAAGVLAQFLFLLVLPLTWETRYFIPAGALAAILFVEGAALMARWLARFAPWLGALTPMILTFGVLAEGGVRAPETVTGFRASAVSIPFRPQGSVILVSSDAWGEGEWVADRLQLDPWKAGVVLRASTVLAQARMGQHYALRVTDADGVVDYLHAAGVRYVVMDHSGYQRPHQVLVEEALRKLSGEFQRIGSFPVKRAQGNGEMEIFASTKVDRNPPEVRLPGFPAWGAYRMEP